ncbi:hypothetical protein KQI84_07980 [bacterium]|nr:hypothetical protein [bacterium]
MTFSLHSVLASFILVFLLFVPVRGSAFGPLVAYDADAISSMSLTSDQVDLFTRFTLYVANPASCEILSKDQRVANAKAFDACLDLLAASATNEQLSIAASLETKSWMAKVLLMASDRAVRKDHYDQVIHYFELDYGTGSDREYPSSYLYDLPRTEEWRLPSEYGLLRPWDYGETRRKAHDYYRVRRDDIEAHVWTEDWDPRALQTLTLYFFALSQQLDEWMADGRCRDHLRANRKATFLLISEFATQEGLNVQAAFSTWSLHPEETGIDVECSSLFGTLDTDRTEWDMLYEQGRSIVRSEYQLGFTDMKMIYIQAKWNRDRYE